MLIPPKTRLVCPRIRKSCDLVAVLPGLHRVLFFGHLAKVCKGVTVGEIHIAEGAALQRFDWLRLRWSPVFGKTVEA